jgi:hypothetical protein
MIEAFKNQDIMGLIENYEAIKIITKESCPIEEVKTYADMKLNAIKEGYYFTNVQKKLHENW